MPQYQFQCQQCHKEFTRNLSPTLGDNLQVQTCECGGEGKRQWDAQAFSIDWVNGGFHGDERINFGTGQFHKSARERDKWAAEHGLVKADV